MNEKSAAPGEDRCDIFLTRHQLMHWFVNNNGKEYSPKEKPLDTPIHCGLRLKWVRTNHFTLTNPYIAVGHLDEKFFYTTNCRRQIKVLPPSPLELLTTAKSVRSTPKMLSRRFPIKAMFMGVVGRPIPHRNFDGKIFLERVSERIPVSKITSHKNFSDDVIINQGIKNGEWRSLFDNKTHLVVIKILTEIYKNYALDESIFDRLELQYTTFVGNTGNTKVVRLENNCNILIFCFGRIQTKTYLNVKYLP